MPKDPVMLLSFVNTQLRDNYNTLEELCKSYMVSERQLIMNIILKRTSLSSSV